MNDNNEHEIEVKHKDLPSPMDKRPAEVSVKLDTKRMLVDRKDIVLYVMYVLFEANMLSRYNLKEMIAVINKKSPEDLAKYVVTEASKA